MSFIEIFKAVNEGLLHSFLEFLLRFISDTWGMIAQPRLTVKSFLETPKISRNPRVLSFYFWHLIAAYVAVGFFAREGFAWPKVSYLELIEFAVMNLIGVLLLIFLISRQVYGRITNPSAMYSVMAGCSVVFVPAAVVRFFLLEILDQRISFAMTYMGGHRWPSLSMLLSPLLTFVVLCYFALLAWGIRLIQIGISHILKSRKSKPGKILAISLFQYATLRYVVFLILYFAINIKAALIINKYYAAALKYQQRDFAEALSLSEIAANSSYLPPFHRVIMGTIAAESRLAINASNQRVLKVAAGCAQKLDEQKFLEAFEFIDTQLDALLQDPTDKDHFYYVQAKNLLDSIRSQRQSPIFLESETQHLAFLTPPTPFRLVPGWARRSYSGFSFQCQPPNFPKMTATWDPIPCNFSWGIHYIQKTNKKT